MISKTAIVFQDVSIGENPEIADFAIIGYFGETTIERSKLIIGDNSVIRPHTIIYYGNQIGNNFQTGSFVSIREYNVIGDNVSIGTHSIIEHHVTIETDVRIHSNVFIPEYTLIKRNAWIGPCVTMTNVFHPKCPKAKDCIKGPVIGQNTVIGANVTILPDVSICDNCLIGSASLVSKNITEPGVYAGSPCKKIMEIEEISCKYSLISNPYI